MFAGETFLQLLAPRERSLEVAGGVILLMIAIRMIFSSGERSIGRPRRGSPSSSRSRCRCWPGPSAMATVLLLASRQPSACSQWVGALDRGDGRVGRGADVLPIASAAAGRLGGRADREADGLVLTAVSVEMILAA
jgi:small neutral amino acid transporter SnatA (MarC family)